MSLKRLAKSFQPRRERVPLDSPHTDDSSSKSDVSRARDSFEEPQESYQDDDDVLAGDITITEGGWICRVERFEKYVDSRGRIHYQRPPKETTLPFLDQDLAGSQEPQILQEDEAKKEVQQSIISYVHYTTKANSRGLVEREAYIEIKSPLILEVLRENANYDQAVRPHNTYCSQQWTYHPRTNVLIRVVVTTRAPGHFT